jgi:hypothetical protein
MEILLYRENFYCQGLLFFTLLHVSAFFLIYSGGQNKVGQVLLRNLAKIELSKPGLL